MGTWKGNRFLYFVENDISVGASIYIFILCLFVLRYGVEHFFGQSFG